MEVPPGHESDPPDRTHIKHPDEVGGYPEIASGTPCVDSDHDGMPDRWEVKNNLNPKRDDSAGYELHSFYTNLEMYLNGTPGEAPSKGREPDAARLHRPGEQTNDE